MRLRPVAGGRFRAKAAGLVMVLAMALAAAQAQHAGGPAKATGGDFRVGGERFVLPAPEIDLPEIGSGSRAEVESLVPAANRLVAAFVPETDARTIRAGGKTQLLKYGLVETPRSAEFAVVDRAAFRQLEESVARQFGGSLDELMKAEETALNQRLKEMNPAAGTVRFEKPVPLGGLFSKPDACSFAMMVPVSSQGQTAKMIASMGVVRVRDRILFVYLYREYQDEGTYYWLRTESERWVEAILKANR